MVLRHDCPLLDRGMIDCDRQPFLNHLLVFAFQFRGLGAVMSAPEVIGCLVIIKTPSFVSRPSHPSLAPVLFHAALRIAEQPTHLRMVGIIVGIGEHPLGDDHYQLSQGSKVGGDEEEVHPGVSRR